MSDIGHLAARERSGASLRPDDWTRRRTALSRARQDPPSVASVPPSPGTPASGHWSCPHFAGSDGVVTTSELLAMVAETTSEHSAPGGAGRVSSATYCVLPAPPAPPVPVEIWP